MADNMDLSPKFPRTFIETEAGVYYNWANADSPLLAEAKLAAGKLVLKPRGFALPHYADCNKLGYVIQGNCGVGLAIPGNDTKEGRSFIRLKEGDVIPVPSGPMSWWYNYGESDVVIVFMGDSSKGYVPGEITYFLLAGPLGPFSAFSPDLIASSYNMADLELAQTLATSQKGVLLIKLGQGEAQGIPDPCNGTIANVLTQNIDSAIPDVEVKNGGKSTTLTATRFPFLDQVGLSVTRLVLEMNATRAPSYAPEARLFYVAKGSGRVQVVGLQNKLVLSSKVETGQLFVVPRFFMAAFTADAHGLELVSIVTSSRTVTGELAGKHSALNTVPSILQVSLNVNSELNQHFMQTLESGTVIVPPKNITSI